jgi:hypothetical protein
MLRKVMLLAAMLAMVLAYAVPAFAASPHFLRASASLDGVNLDVSFKEAGLGNNATIDYRASADASATYVCVNRGGKNPSASNKRFVSGRVDATGTFSSDKNGSISETLTINPPPAPESFSCPGGQVERLAQVTYTNVKIKDVTNNITETIPGTFDTGCLLPNVKGAC